MSRKPLAAVASTGRTASVIGAMLFFVLMFFAGLGIPRALMPETLLQASNYTPLGAGVRVMQDSIFGGGPALAPLAVLGAHAIISAAVAARVFRWQ